MTGGGILEYKIQFLLWEVGCERGFMVVKGVVGIYFGKPMIKYILKLWSEKCPIEKR
jgi:hypothetical protein